VTNRPSHAAPPDQPWAARVLEVVHRVPHIIGITDDAGRVLWLNDAGRRFIGATPDERLTTADLFTDAVFDRYYASIRPALLRDGMWSGELPVRRADGSTGVVEAVAVSEVGPDGEVRWIGALAVDVTGHHEREAALSHQASHDPLTGLPNRLLLLDRLDVAMSIAERMRSPLAVLALDLDGFKAVNDEHGHAIGDRLLQQVTARIESAVRTSDTVARVGGDEFVVVVHPPEEQSAAMAVAERIRDQIGLLDYVIGEQQLRVTASIGLVLSETGTRVEPAQLLAAADRGMYRAKRTGGNCVRVASSERPGLAGQRDRTGEELARALAEGQVVAVFEPVIDLASQDLCALQALARWNHPDLGPLPAHRFAEEAIIAGNADLIWWAATRDALRAVAKSRAIVPVHITLSTSQLREDDVVTRLRALRELAPETEVHLRVDAHSVLDLTTMGQPVIDSLAEEGLPLVLTGHGRRGMPLAVLASLPLAAVELDPSLVRDAPEIPKAVALATRLAETLDIPCIAQVHDDADLPMLASLGVTSASGPVAGEAWDAERLAAEMAARRATRPRP